MSVVTAVSFRVVIYWLLSLSPDMVSHHLHIKICSTGVITEERLCWERDTFLPGKKKKKPKKRENLVCSTWRIAQKGLRGVVIASSALSHHARRGESLGRGGKKKLNKSTQCQEGDRFEIAASSEDAQVGSDGGINRGRRTPAHSSVPCTFTPFLHYFFPFSPARGGKPPNSKCIKALLPPVIPPPSFSIGLLSHLSQRAT